MSNQTNQYNLDFASREAEEFAILKSLPLGEGMAACRLQFLLELIVGHCRGQAVYRHTNLIQYLRGRMRLSKSSLHDTVKRAADLGLVIIERGFNNSITAIGVDFEACRMMRDEARQRQQRESAVQHAPVDESPAATEPDSIPSRLEVTRQNGRSREPDEPSDTRTPVRGSDAPSEARTLPSEARKPSILRLPKTTTTAAQWAAAAAVVRESGVEYVDKAVRQSTARGWTPEYVISTVDQAVADRQPVRAIAMHLIHGTPLPESRRAAFARDIRSKIRKQAAERDRTPPDDCVAAVIVKRLTELGYGDQATDSELAAANRWASRQGANQDANYETDRDDVRSNARAVR